MNEYDKQAEDFLKETNSTLTTEYLGHFAREDWDDQVRAQFRFTLRRGNLKLTGQFTKSVMDSFKLSRKINDSIEMPQHIHVTKDGKKGWIRKVGNVTLVLDKTPPSPYSILACLNSYDVGIYADFCEEFGYDGGEKSLKIWLDLSEQVRQLQRMYSQEELDKLNEIW